MPPGSAEDRLPRVGAVTVRMPPAHCKPLPTVKGDQREPADHALAALVISVEQIDHNPLLPRDSLADVGDLGIGHIAVRALPEGNITGGDIEVSSKPAKRLHRRDAPPP